MDNLRRRLSRFLLSAQLQYSLADRVRRPIGPSVTDTSSGIPRRSRPPFPFSERRINLCERFDFQLSSCRIAVRPAANGYMKEYPREEFALPESCRRGRLPLRGYRPLVRAAPKSSHISSLFVPRGEMERTEPWRGVFLHREKTMKVPLFPTCPRRTRSTFSFATRE